MTMSETTKSVEEIIKINIDYVSNKNGIDKEHCKRFPVALAKQLYPLISKAVLDGKIEEQKEHTRCSFKSEHDFRDKRIASLKSQREKME